VLAAVTLPQLGGSSGSDASGGGGGGGAADRVGRRVVLQSTTGPHSSTTLSAYLTRETGKAMSLCSSLESATERGSGDTAAGSNSGGGACTAAQPGPSRQVPYLTGGSDGSLQTLVGAASAQVVSLRAWATDGSTRPVPLKGLGVRGLRAFGFVTRTGQPLVQRLGAYDATGALLGTVDVNELLAAAWLPATGSCSGADIVTPVPVPGLAATAAVAATHAGVAVAGTGQARGKGATVCLPLTRTLQGVRLGPRTALVLVAPEIDSVDLVQGSSHKMFAADPQRTGTIWRLVVVRADRSLDPADTVVAQSIDAGSQVGQPLRLSELADAQVRP